MKAIVLLSGGQDSTTCLAWAVQQYGKEEVLALTINYGQRHISELISADMVARLAEVKHLEIPVAAWGAALGDASALTGVGSVSDVQPNGLPASFVPGRNALFLTIAASVAAAHNARTIVAGVCQTDYSGYPDCRREFIDLMEQALTVGIGPRAGQRPPDAFHIETPLMWLTKAETVKLMFRLTKEWWLGHTQTCYEGKRPPCMKCPACLLRAKGFEEAGLKDPLIAEAKSSPVHF